MTKTQHKTTTVASMFQNGISQNTKYAVRDGFHRDSHIFGLNSVSFYIHQTNEASAGNLEEVKKSGGLAHVWMICS